MERVIDSCEAVRQAACVLVVEDTGPGIEPEFLPHVFEMFRQADASSSRPHGGMGIGLALVRQLVELHGGTVAVASSPGPGREVYIELPLTVKQRNHYRITGGASCPARLVRCDSGGRRFRRHGRDAAQLFEMDGALSNYGQQWRWRRSRLRENNFDVIFRTSQCRAWTALSLCGACAR